MRNWFPVYAGGQKSKVVHRLVHTQAFGIGPIVVWVSLEAEGGLFVLEGAEHNVLRL